MRDVFPSITAVIPAYNQPALLQEALHSVAHQEEVAFSEIIVTDDMGSPATKRVVEASGLSQLRYFPNSTRLGAVANWNRGIFLARSEWITVLHEDDLLYPHFLRSVRDRLRDGLSAVVVRCERGTAPQRSGAARVRRGARRYPPEYFLKSATTPFPGVVFPRRIALELGGFDERWGPLADYEFWYRLSTQGITEVLPTWAAFYRIRDDQWTVHAWQRMLRLTHLLRLRIARERFADFPDTARWFARFYTLKNARTYRRRFGDGQEILTRVARLKAIPLHGLSSGWAWLALQSLARLQQHLRTTRRKKTGNPDEGFLSPSDRLMRKEHVV